MVSVLTCVAIHTYSSRDMLNTEKSIWNCSQYDIYPIKKRPKKILAQNITPAQKAPWQTGSSMGHIILCFLRISLFSSKGKTKRICSVYGTMRKMPLLKILLDIPEKKIGWNISSHAVLQVIRGWPVTGSKGCWFKVSAVWDTICSSSEKSMYTEGVQEYRRF